MKKILLVMLMFVMVIFSGCREDSKEDTIAKIVLTADKSEIMADGTDKVIFTAKCYSESGEKISENGVKIYLGSEEIKTGSFTATIIGEYVFRAELGDIKSKNLIITAKEIGKLTKIELTSDKIEIIANGTDKVTFTTKCYDQYNNVINISDIKLYSNETEQTSMMFKTEKSGSYKLTAKSGEVISNEIIVNAKEAPKLAKIELTADKTEITANGIDKVTFTTKCYDQYNNTINISDIKLYNNIQIPGQTALSFSSSTAGDYKFTAKSGEIISNEISVTVKPEGELAKIVLSATKTEITANGSDYSKFIITSYDKDGNVVTTTGNLYLDGNIYSKTTFDTTVSGSYVFKMVSGSITSNEITITAKVEDISYSMAKRMLGTWTMSISDGTREYYTFNEIYNNDGVYCAAGYITKIYFPSSGYSYNSAYELAIAYYDEEEKSMVLGCYWGATATTGSVYMFNIGTGTTISGDNYFMYDGEVSSYYTFTGTKNSKINLNTKRTIVHKNINFDIDKYREIIKKKKTFKYKKVNKSIELLKK